MYYLKNTTLADAPLIRELASQVWSDTYKNILSPDQLDYMFEMMYSIESLHRQMAEGGHCFFIVWKDEVPVGYLSIEQKEDKLFNFQKIYTIPSVHGQGIGRFLVESGISYLKEHYHTPFTVELYVNRSNKAVDFYKHIGFKVVDTRDHAIGNGYYMNDYIMNLEVT